MRPSRCAIAVGVIVVGVLVYGLVVENIIKARQPVAIVAADTQEAARRAAAAVAVAYDPLEPLTDPEEAERRGEVFRTMHVVNGDPGRRLRGPSPIPLHVPVRDG